MNSNDEANKKSFWLIYLIVGIFYAIMIVIYGVVCHLATEDGAVSKYTVDDAADENSATGALFDMVNRLFSSFQEGVKANGVESMQTLDVMIQ